MLFSKTYELPISRDYVRHWGLTEAVREILQNAIDSESPFEFSFEYGHEEHPDERDGMMKVRPTGEITLRIASRYGSLSPSTLLLGTTSKAENKDAIGSFGEGYKIALLVLTRLNYEVVIHNGDRDWRPVFRESKQFGGVETLNIVETSGERAAQGIEFVIHRLSAADEAAIRESCLFMQGNIGEQVKTSTGRILFERPGKLYVGGLFVCDTEMKYGYDVKPEFLRLERDRQTVSTFDLAFLTKDMWFESKRFDDTVRLIEEEAKDMQYAQYGTPEVVKEACYRAFRQLHPGKLVAKTKEELADKIRGAMKVYVGSSYGAIVASSDSYRAEKFTRQETPRETLEAFFRDHRSEMRTPAIVAFKELIRNSDRWSYK